MSRRRFLVERIADNAAELCGEEAWHLARVLRAQPGQQYEISDGANLYLAEISSVESERVTFRTIEALGTPSPLAQVTLFAALIKFDRFEWLVEKATELGVAAIVPVNAARSERGLLEGARKRVERWRRIAHESSQQSRRLAPPEIGEPLSFDSALAPREGVRCFLDEQAGLPPLGRTIGPNQEQIALLTGPEGGWTDHERTAAAESAGWMRVSLGPQVLRAETAAIAAAAIILHARWAAQLE